MHFFKHLKPINDIFFVSNYLSKINTNYKLFYNTNLERYEVHDLKSKPSLLITYNKYPDQNLITKLLQTSKQNMSQLFKEIDIHNNKLNKQYEQNLLDTAKKQMHEIIKYSNSKPTINLSQNNLKKIIHEGD